MIHAVTDQNMWAEKYDRDLEDILALHSEVAQAIAQEIKINLTPQEQVRLTTSRRVNPEAYEAFLKDRFHWNKATEEGLRKSLEYFQQAIAEDPSYAAAYAGVADAYCMLGVGLGSLPAKEAYPRAKEAALMALELDNTLAEAHLSLAYVAWFDFDWLEGERELKRAIELNPSYSTAHMYYSWYLVGTERHDQGLAEIKRAMELDPLSIWINMSVAWVLYQARQYDQAIEQFRRTLELDPDFQLAHFYFVLPYVQKGMYEEAIAEAQKAITLSGGSTTLYVANLGWAYAVSGKREEALKVLNELIELSKHKFVQPYEIALVYLGLGDKDQAFALLEKTFQQRGVHLLYLKVEPMFDSLRNDPRFHDLVRRMNFPD